MEKLLPQYVEGEAAFLGAAQIDPDVLVTCAEIVRPEDFYRDAHHTIAQVVYDLFTARQPVDVITLVDELERRGKLEEVGGASYVSSLANNVPTTAHAEHYAQIVADKAVLRQMIFFAGQVAGVAYDEVAVQDALEQVRRWWHSIEERATRGARGRRGLVRAGVALDEVLADVLARMDPTAQRQGVRTGYRDLDAHLLSLEPGELTYICGRPGSGKTTLVQGIADHTVDECEATGDPDGGCVAWFSFEMRRTQVMNHLVCKHAGVNTQLWRAGFRRSDGQMARATYERWRQGYDERYHVLDRRLRIQDTRCTVREMEARLTRLVDEEGCRLALVDYVGLITPDDRKAQRYQQMTDISIALKGMAQDLGIPVVAVVQMSRANMGRENKRPDMSDLKDSGQQEQDADFILGVHRPAYYDHARASEDEDFRRFVEVLVLKAREGVGDNTLIPLRAELEYSRMTTWPDQRAWPADPSRSRSGGADTYEQPVSDVGSTTADQGRDQERAGGWWNDR